MTPGISFNVILGAICVFQKIPVFVEGLPVWTQLGVFKSCRRIDVDLTSFLPTEHFVGSECCKVAAVGEKEKRWAIKKLAMRARYPEQLDRKDISLGQLVG